MTQNEQLLTTKERRRRRPATLETSVQLRNSCVADTAVLSVRVCTGLAAGCQVSDRPRSNFRVPLTKRAATFSSQHTLQLVGGGFRSSSQQRVTVVNPRRQSRRRGLMSSHPQTRYWVNVGLLWADVTQTLDTRVLQGLRSDEIVTPSKRTWSLAATVSAQFYLSQLSLTVCQKPVQLRSAADRIN